MARSPGRFETALSISTGLALAQPSTRQRGQMTLGSLGALCQDTLACVRNPPGSWPLLTIGLLVGPVGVKTADSSAVAPCPRATTRSEPRGSRMWPDRILCGPSRCMSRRSGCPLANPLSSKFGWFRSGSIPSHRTLLTNSGSSFLCGRLDVSPGGLVPRPCRLGNGADFKRLHDHVGPLRYIGW